MREHELLNAETFNRTVDQYIANTDSKFPREAGERFMSMLREGASILDIGCGPGRDAEIFSKHGFKVTGIDFAENMIAAARKRVKDARFEVMNFRKLEFPDSSFDGIWANASYHFIGRAELPEALAEAYGTLRTGGLLFISAKSGSGEEIMDDKRYGVKKFETFYSLRELKELAVKAGFSVLDANVESQKSAYATHPWINVFCRK